MRLWGAVAALALGGCLLPQDDTVLPEIPRPKNTSPQILSVEPAPRTTIRVGENCRCPDSPFRIFVRDPDPQEIRSRWFVDVPQGSKYGDFTYADGKRVQYQGSALRNAPVESPSTLCAVNNSALLVPTTGRDPHFVEVFIADGEFEDFTADKDVVQVKPDVFPAPDGGTVHDEKRAVHLFWNVHSDPSPCQ